MKGAYRAARFQSRSLVDHEHQVSRNPLSSRRRLIFLAQREVKKFQSSE
jgi:hypothetical protein